MPVYPQILPGSHFINLRALRILLSQHYVLSNTPPNTFEHTVSPDYGTSLDCGAI